MTTIVHKLTAAAVLASLTGCAQLAANQAKIESAVASNAVKVQAACGVVLAIANDPGLTLAAAAIPVVGQVQAAVKAGCGTADGIASMAQSASTVDWLGTAKTVLESKGAVLPAPVAPVPVSGS